MGTAHPADRPRIRPAWHPWLILAAGLIAYSNSFSGAFVFDDHRAILENPNVRTLWPLSEAVGSPPRLATSGRPLVNLSLAVNYALGKDDPAGYHALNLAVHLAAALALLGVLRRTFRGPSAGPLAFVAALLWTVHPIQTECVTYISTRTESMMGLFYLLTLYCFLRAAASPAPSGWQTACVVACALGMAAKQVMASAPLMVLLYDRAFIAGSFAGAMRARWKLYAGLASTWLLLIWLTVRVWDPASQVYGFGCRHISSLEYALTETGVLVYYLRLSVWPHPLVIDYHDWPVARSLAQVWPQCMAIAGLAGLTAWGLVRNRRAAFLGAWFFLILAPTSSVLAMPEEIAAERRMYLPLAAFLAAAVVGFWRGFEWCSRTLVLRSAMRRFLPAALAGVAAISFGVQTYLRNGDYADELALWQLTVRQRPDNARALNNLGVFLGQAGEYGQAETCFLRVVELEPTHLFAHLNLGFLYDRSGHLPEAMAHYEEAIRQRPTEGRARKRLAVLYAKTGSFERAVELLATPEGVAEPVRLAEEIVRGTAVEERAEVLDLLAAVYARAGRALDAARTARDALAAARAAGQKELAERIGQRLKKYELEQGR